MAYNELSNQGGNSDERAYGELVNVFQGCGLDLCDRRHCCSGIYHGLICHRCCRWPVLLVHVCGTGMDGRSDGSADREPGAPAASAHGADQN